MHAIREYLKGKKTYIVSALMVLVALTELMSGSMTFAEFMNSENLVVLLQGLGISTLRAGIAK